MTILDGSFDEKLSLKFLSQNNRANKDVISQLKNTWDGKNSIVHNAIINCYAIMHSGTLDDTYLQEKENLTWVTKSTHWAQFLNTAC